MSTTAELIVHEFPDFDLATLPAIPEGFTCHAWHNDSCPVWYEGDATTYTRGQLMLAIDYADANMREWPDSQRYSLHMVSEDNSSPEPMMSSDDWEDISRVIQAIRVSRK